MTCSGTIIIITMMIIVIIIKIIIKKTHCAKHDLFWDNNYVERFPIMKLQKTAFSRWPRAGLL